MSVSVPEGLCPICLTSEASHEHHIIPREITLMGVKGVNGPTVYLCPNDHSKLHWQALSLISKSPVKKTYFTTEEMGRVARYLQVLVLALTVGRQGQDAGQQIKTSVSFTIGEMRVLHMVQKDRGYKDASRFIHDVMLDYLRQQL